MTRTCNSCKIVKSLDDFYNDKNRPLGKHYTCKLCLKEMVRRSIKTPQARVGQSARRKKYNQSEKGKAWRAAFLKQPEQKAKAAARRIKNRATQRGRYREFEALLLRYYGITVEDWAHMFNDQRGCCAACDDPLTFDRHTHVDHDHTTGRVRGLLCRMCNIALGSARESVARLNGLINYVRTRCESED